MNKVAVVIIGCLVVGFFVFGLSSYNKANKLERENQQLQQKIKNLTSQNQYYQKQISVQLQEQTTKENDEDAESKAVQFVKVYHNSSLNQQEWLQSLKKLMVPQAFAKKINNQNNNQDETGENSNIQGRVEIKNIQSFKDGDIHKVNIDYDYIGSVDNTENFVEKMNIVVHMVVNGGKWLVNDFELTFKEGPENHAD